MRIFEKKKKVYTHDSLSRGNTYDTDGEEDRAQQSDPLVETLLEVFVRAGELEIVENRQEYDGYDETDDDDRATDEEVARTVDVNLRRGPQ